MTENGWTSDEPFGHTDYYSKIERAWRRMPPGTSLRRRRTTRFDTSNSILYEPVEYEHPSIEHELPEALPDDEWIKAALKDFVRGEFGAGEVRRPLPTSFSPDIVDENATGVDFLEGFLERCEAELVYAGRVTDIVRSGRTDDIVGNMFEVLCDPLLGHRRNRTHIQYEQFAAAIDQQVQHRDRLLFLVPSFPFKDQNRFRTFSGASTVDLGEVALLVRLHALALALYQIHPFGADIVVLSDGLLYSSVFGVDQAQARRYREQLRGFRNLLNVQGTVSILDLSEVIGHVDGAAGDSGPFARCRAHIAQVIRSTCVTAAEVADVFAVLKRGMKWNLNTRDSLAHLEEAAAWRVLNDSCSDCDGAGLRDDWERIDQAATDAAVDYAAVNLTMRYFDVLEKIFPGALRGTVHPKPGQFAVPVGSSVYPWNGVALARRTPPGAADVETRPLLDLYGQKVVLTRLDMTGEPLFFQRIGSDHV